MLFLIATPIGNLADLTFRAVSTMQECDYLLCEDTRTSRVLLSHYDIKKPLKSFHMFNEKKREEGVIEDLKNGMKIGLLSDAGTPGIADPGERLVKRCVEEEIRVVALPGPCAAITALSCSGLTTERFQFIGFLPRKPGRLKKLLAEILAYEGTSICYESPFRVTATLKKIQELDPARLVVAARELTKKFEEITRGTPAELLEKWKGGHPKGEFVLLISQAVLALESPDC